MTISEIMLSIMVLMCFAAALCANARAEREEKEKKKYKSICDGPIQVKQVNLRPSRLFVKEVVEPEYFMREEPADFIAKRLVGRMAQEILKHKELYRLHSIDIPKLDLREIRAEIFIIPAEEARRAGFSSWDV